MDRPLFRRVGNLSTMQLMTQQLRLRNLTKIEGINIIADRNCLVYYTLHYKYDEKFFFYKSEPVPQHVEKKWAEIVCPEILKSNKNCVCIKVWVRSQLPQNQSVTERNERHQQKESFGDFNTSNSSWTSRTHESQSTPPDKMLFSWGVYFSGLTMLKQKTNIEFAKNALILQMNGVDFCSSDYFFVSNVAEQQQPVSMYQRNTFSDSATNLTSPDPFLINSPRVSRSSSPAIGDFSKSATRSKTENGRLLQLICWRSDVRRSYDLEKLLRLQDTQRQRMQINRECAEIADNIKQLSIRCITTEQLKRYKRSTISSLHSSSRHSMGRKLSILLADEGHIEPAILLQARGLQQELEALRFRNSLLVSEQKIFMERTKNLQSKLSTIIEARKQLEKCLHFKVSELEKEKLMLKEQYQQYLKQSQFRRHIVQNVEKRMSILCLELQEIYPIKRNENGMYTICNVPFPRLDTASRDSRNISTINSDQISPLALSASLGYVAHLVQMISVIIDQPLRNPIVHEGSRSRMQDVNRGLPYGTKDYPLYSRSLIPSKFVRHALFLLNQNIVQLRYDITGTHSDLRATMENLIDIFRVLSDIEERLHEEVRPLMRTHPNCRRKINTSGSDGSIKDHNSETFSTDEIDTLAQSISSIDEHQSLHHAMLLRIPKPSQPLKIAENTMESVDQRVSRSVGSYSDNESNILKDIVWRAHSNSESNIAFRSKNT